jgi:hypothetical protein
MTVSPQQLELFKTFFSGMTQGHGRSNLTGKTHVSTDDKNGKIEAKVGWVDEEVTDKHWEKHLTGVEMLGISPITNESKVRWCCVDVDNYANPLKNKALVDTVYRYNMPIVPMRTKSGGLHLFLFFSDFVTGQQGQIYMNYFRRALGLDAKTERFPKQATINPKKNEKGSWLNMPYFAHEDTTRYLIQRNYEGATLDEALIIIKSKLQTIESLREFINTLPFSDGPPCLQTIAIQGNTDHRNDYLYNVARYAKTKHGDDFPTVVKSANSDLDSPLDDREIETSVIRSFTKKDYAYKCKEAPIVSFCDKAECKLREYGVGGQKISNLNYEEMTQYKTDPPYYEWKISGALLKFFSEQEILNQQFFRARVFRELNEYPYRLEDDEWTKIINTASNNIRIVEVDINDDISPGGIFKRHLVTFLMDRSLTAQKKHVLTGSVYDDAEQGVFVFQPHRFLEYLERQNFKAFTTTEIHSRIKDFAGKPISYTVTDEAANGEKTEVRVWAIPKNNIIAPNNQSEREALKNAVMVETPVTETEDF